MINEEINNNLMELQTLIMKADTMTKKLYGFQTPSSRHYFASILFARVFIQFYNLFQILENSQKQNENNITFPIDTPSMASIIRSIVELYRVFYYGVIEEVSDDERDLRYLKFNFKSAYDKKRIVKKFYSYIPREDKENNDICGSLEEEVIKLKDEIRNHDFFDSLNDSEKQRCLSEGSAMYLDPKEIEKRAGLEEEHQDGMYIILSSEAHATPFALEQTAGNVANTGFAQLTLRLLLTYAIDYLKMYIKGMIELFPQLFHENILSE
jgi:hypothetical protein